MGARPVLAAMLTVAAASEIRTTTATADSRIPLNVARKSAKVNALFGDARPHDRRGRAGCS